MFRTLAATATTHLIYHMNAEDSPDKTILGDPHNTRTHPTDATDETNLENELFAVPADELCFTNDVITLTGQVKVIHGDDDGPQTRISMNSAILNMGLHPDPTIFAHCQLIAYGSNNSANSAVGYVPNITANVLILNTRILNICVEHFKISTQDLTHSLFKTVEEINLETPRVSLWSLDIAGDPKLFSLICDAITRSKLTYISFNKHNLEQLKSEQYEVLLTILQKHPTLQKFDLLDNDPTPNLHLTLAHREPVENGINHNNNGANTSSDNLFFSYTPTALVPSNTTTPASSSIITTTSIYHGAGSLPMLIIEANLAPPNSTISFAPSNSTVIFSNGLTPITIPTPPIHPGTNVTTPLRINQRSNSTCHHSTKTNHDS